MPVFDQSANPLMEVLRVFNYKKYVVLAAIINYINSMPTNTPDQKRRPGRPAIDPDRATLPIAIRLTTAQREKLAKLGGPPWVRDKIDKAKLPKE
jgi:hypothetical protein